MICISLANISFDECMNAMSGSVFTEIRIDQLQLTEEQIKKLCTVKKEIIVTCRPGIHTEEERLGLLSLAMDAGAGYIDIEYEAPKAYREKLVQHARVKNVCVIISYHDFDKTPDRPELENIIQTSVTMGADRVKIATMANQKADSARILSLYESHTGLIAFCMGKEGMITRVAAPYLGADFTYASLTKELATAPGQLTGQEFMDIFRILL